jgi:hypothetical protein
MLTNINLWMRYLISEHQLIWIVTSNPLERKDLNVSDNIHGAKVRRKDFLSHTHANDPDLAADKIQLHG